MSKVTLVRRLPVLWRITPWCSCVWFGGWNQLLTVTVSNGLSICAAGKVGKLFLSLSMRLCSRCGNLHTGMMWSRCCFHSNPDDVLTMKETGPNCFHNGGRHPTRTSVEIANKNRLTNRQKVRFAMVVMLLFLRCLVWYHRDSWIECSKSNLVRRERPMNKTDGGTQYFLEEWRGTRGEN